MLKSTLLLAMLVGLAMPLALPLKDKMEETVDMEESVLLIPETELLTNKTVVLESLPKIEKVVQEEELKDKEEIKAENISEQITRLKREIVNDQIELREKENLIQTEMASLDELKESELNTELQTAELYEELKSHLKVNSNATRIEITSETKKYMELEDKMKKQNEEINTFMSKLEDSKVRVQKLLEKLKMKESKVKKLMRKLKKTSHKLIKESEKFTKMFSKDLKKEFSTPEVVLNATAPEVVLNLTAQEVILNVTEPEMKKENVSEIKEEAKEEAEEKNEESDDDEDDDEEEESEDRETKLEVRSILENLVSMFENKTKETEDFILNDYCRSEDKFKYYRAHPTSAEKYVECNIWGKGTVRECPAGRVWDQFHEICSTLDLIKVSQNLTAEFLQLQKIDNTLEQNCNSSDFKCMNGGECVAVEDRFECKCTKRYFGIMCENRVIKNSIFSQIMTDKFDLNEFKAELESAFDSNEINKEDMTELKKIVKESTHDEIMAYLENFKDGQMRYDMILNNLIENVLEDIYPDAYYLSVFNASSHSLIDVVRTIPSLISYTKYSRERYNEVFMKYQEALLKIVDSLNSTWTNAQRDAIEYIKISDHIINETHFDIQSFNRTTLSDVNMSLDAEYKQTEETNRLMINLQALRRNLIREMVMRPAMVNKKLSEMTRKSNVRDLITIFDKVANNSVNVINSLFSYGFWFITDSFAQHF